MLFIVAFLFAIVNSAGIFCRINPWTSWYLDGHHRIPRDFYDPNTAFTDGDACEVFNETEFKEIYPSNLTAGVVDHIVDLDNSILEGCNKNIRGNMIIAKVQWLRVLKYACWEDVMKEKRAVYGNQTVDKAINSIKQCCSPQPLTIAAVVGIVLVICTAIAITIIVGLMFRKPSVTVVE